MRGDVVGPVTIQVVGNLGQQPLGLPGQVCRVGCRFVGDLTAQRRVAREGVDIALLDPVEPQTEQQIFADEAR